MWVLLSLPGCLLIEAFDSMLLYKILFIFIYKEATSYRSSRIYFLGILMMALCRTREGVLLQKFLVVVRNTVHLGPSFQQLLLLFPILQQSYAGSFIVYRPIRSVVDVCVIQVRKFRLERLSAKRKVWDLK